MSKCNSEIGWLTKRLIPTKMATSLLVEKNLAVIACLTKKIQNYGSLWQNDMNKGKFTAEI